MSVSDTPATLGDLEVLFGNVVKVILGFAGIVFFILLLSSGLKFMTSGGDPKAVEGAKKTLTYAIGGLIAIILAYLILVLIKQLTGVDVTTFKVVQPQ
jgi:hypothetical protein